MADELLSREDGPVHRLTLNRPARRNALTPELAAAIAQELDLIEERGAAQVVVLGGAGGHFCAGLDLHWLRSLGARPARGRACSADSPTSSRPSSPSCAARSRCSRRSGAPAAGFGLDLALACDMRLAESGATFTSAFARMGLVPDGGSTFTLPRLVGPGSRAPIPHGRRDGERRARLRARPGGRGRADGRAGRRGRRRWRKRSPPRPRRASAPIKRLVRADELGALEQALAAEGAAQIQALQSPEFQRRLEAFVTR